MDEERARHLLSDTIYVLRAALGDDALITSGKDLRLNTDAIFVDAVGLEDALAREEFRTAVTLYEGPFLDGFYLSDAPAFNAWVDVQRQHYADSYSAALQALAERAKEQGDHEQALGWWKKLAAANPYDSRIALRLMKALASAGNPAIAIRHAEVHAELLREELDMEPPVAVLDLAEQLRSQPSGRPVAAAPATVEHRGTQGAEPITAGIGEDSEEVEQGQVSTAAGRIGGSTLQRGLRKSASKRLGVPIALAVIAAAAVGAALWVPNRVGEESGEGLRGANAEAYDYYRRAFDYYNRDWTSEESIEIAAQLYEKAIELDPGFASAYAMLSQVHSWSYFAYYDRTKERLEKARNAAEKALQLDPDLPEGHMALGLLHYRGLLDYDRALEEFALVQKMQPDDPAPILFRGGVRRRQGEYREAILIFKKASELDPNSANTPYYIAETLILLPDYPQAEEYLDRALSRRPDFQAAYEKKALMYLNWDGHTRRARASLEAAEQNLGPAAHPSITFHWVMVDLMDRDYESALERLSAETNEIFENQFYFVPKTLLLAQLYGLIEQKELAQAYYDSVRIVLEAGIRDRPEDSRLHGSLAIAYAGLGRAEDAIVEAKLAVGLVTPNMEAWRGLYRVAELARVYTMIGDADQAIDQLEFLVSNPGEMSVNLLRLDPVWDPLRDNPRFEKLVQREDPPARVP